MLIPARISRKHDNISYPAFIVLWYFAQVRTNIRSAVPAKPVWYRKLPYILKELRNHPLPFVDRATLEFLLGISRRRAQQIMAPCIMARVGMNGLADRDALITRLERIAEGDEGFHEIQRRRKVAKMIADLRQERIEKPQLLVEAPTAVVNQELESLPAGVHLEPGRITVEFENSHQGLEKLLALAMAISNDFDRFERWVGGPG
jgi:hypothetical protein